MKIIPMTSEVFQHFSITFATNCYQLAIHLIITFFSITHCDWQANSGTSIMSSILQIPQITRCPGLKLDIDVTQLPVREISNWLHGTSDDAKGNNGQKNAERLLTIFSRSIQNIEEMCCALKVLFYF